MDNFLNQMQNEFRQVKQEFKTAFNENAFDRPGANQGMSGGMAGGAGSIHNQNVNNGNQMMEPAVSELPTNRNVNFGGRRLYIEKLLGEGGFAFVYQVLDNSTGQRFALKKMMTNND